jgi:hypothetical protein
VVLAANVLLVSSCSDPDGLEHIAVIASSEVVASVDSTSGPDFAVQKTYVGGATGDTLFKVWSCKSTNSECRLQAIVDTNDQPAPILSMNEGALNVIVNKSDVVWNFCNVSIKSGGNVTKVNLTYR